MQQHERELHREPRKTGSARSCLGRGLFAVFFAIFVGGGLYFGYIFVTTTVSLLTGAPGSGNLPFTGGPGGPGGPEQPITNLPEWHGDERLNILLLGLDQREDERGKPTRSDTMIVLTVDPLAKTAAMIAFPRDLWVVIPGHGENKINTAHFFGEADAAGQGPALAKKTIEVNFGLRMHYYARVDFRGFERLVDAVGGVTIDARKPIKDDEYPEGDYGIRRIYIPAGLQHLDGKTALQYARSRHADNDISRAQRQMQVIVAAKNQAMRLDLLPRLPSLLGLLRDTVSTDVPMQDMLGLINLGRQIDSKNIASLAVDWGMVDDVYGRGEVLVPKWEVIRPFMAQIFADPRLKAENAGIVVQNGTLRDGLAAAVGVALTGRGFRVEGVSQAQWSDYRETVVIDHTGKRATAQALADILHVTPQNLRSEPGQDQDITIILGADAKVP